MNDFLGGVHKLLFVTKFVQVMISQEYTHFFQGNRTDAMRAGQDPRGRYDGAAANVAKSGPAFS